MNAPLTIALTETVNAFSPMPELEGDVGRLADRLEDIRRANVQHHAALIERAARRGAAIIGLGELFTAPYFALHQHPVWRGLAEDAEDGPTVLELSEVARRLQVAIVAPIYERDRASGERFNTAVVLAEDGRVLGKYRKAHIPDGENEQNAFHEPFYFRAAREGDDTFPVFETRLARVGVSICYDRHFEGVVRSLAARGAEVIFSPAVTFGAKSERMWELEFEVDAARHGVFVAGSNRCGVEPPFRQRYFGRSYVVGPNGRPAIDRTEPGLVLATLDLDELRVGDPSGWNLGRDRRPKLYVP